MSKAVSRREFLRVSAATMASATTAMACSGGWPFSAQSTDLRGLGTAVPWVEELADGYVAVAPRTLWAGQAEPVSVSLFSGSQPARSTVTVALLKDGRAVEQASERVAGRGAVELRVPTSLAAGEYQLQVSGQGFQDQAPIQVESGTLVFVETDKPIYKPGQTVHMRVLGVDPTLKPASGEAVVEVMDAKGIKVFKKTATMDDFGMGETELPLSSEPNLGTWKVKATLGKRSSQVDVRVERYVLPKYEVAIELPKEWALASEKITGTVGAEYSFGKPVRGEAEIVALRYVGTWQEYARVSKAIDGKTTFELPAVQYAAGSPGAGGMSTVRLDVTVREQSTGYEEQNSRLVSIAQSAVSVRLIPESNTFKPGLPFSLLVVAERPDKQPVDTDVEVRLAYQKEDLSQLSQETQRATTKNGVAVVKVTPPDGAASLRASAQTLTLAQRGVSPSTTVRAGYSPSGSFIHVEQVTRGALKVGDTAKFKVSATKEARNFYYEVLSRGKVVFSDFARSDEIELTLTPLMAPEARLLVYQVLQNGEVAADYLPFKVAGTYPHSIQASFGAQEARPGDEVEVRVQTEGAAKVGLVAVDRSVFILAENRLNLQQVFDELERLYMQPQAELHEAEPIGAGPMPMPVPEPGGDAAVGRPGGGVRGAPMAVAPVGRVAAPPDLIPGAKEVFRDAGVVVLTNRQVPEGKRLQIVRPEAMMAAERAAMPAAAAKAAAPAMEDAAGAARTTEQDEGLAEVQRVRQFFPETWVWAALTTDAGGRGVEKLTAPDSITTWMLRAVALSKDKGLGITEAELRVFQPFFVQVDLPYSTIRGEELPARVALYNYESTAQEFQVDLEGADWFDLLDTRTKRVTVRPNEVGGVAFTIRPKALGVKGLKVTARSRSAADAIVKELIVEPEGVQRETVENLVLAAGSRKTVDLLAPPEAVDGSSRAQVAVTGNVLSQTIEGLEGLLKMPFGCGEQNMILFAPNVFISQYLKETGQLKPEVMAKAEKLMLTGYQRELTYRRGDGSFSAFGQQDKEGSLWLTAFVLKTFAQAKDLIYIDENVLTGSGEWIRQHQKGDGSFEPVGFVHHQELLGGLKGTTALTGFVSIALREAGDDATAGRAERYLEGQLGRTNDAYSLAISSYALGLGKSGRAREAVQKLMGLARESEEGLSWEDEGPVVRGQGPGGGAEVPEPGIGPMPLPHPRRSAAIETTGYATLALLAVGDLVNASKAVRWLASRRNAYGGFGSTQDTVVALQAMATAASSTRADVDATVILQAGNWRKEVRVTPSNADVLQVVEAPSGGPLTLEAQGRGQVMAQAVHRYNLPAVDRTAPSVFQIDVRYGADQVEVNDLISVETLIRFTPPMPIAAGMVVLDVSVPTGFEAVGETVEQAVQREAKIKRWDVAGRKVIFYIEDMLPNEELRFTFQARALYPVRAQAVASQVYSYYRPEWKGEALGGEVVVR